MRKIQLGMPITIIKGGIKAVSTVISYFKRPIIPKVHITPIQTVKSDISVARNDLKKKKKISEVTKRATPMNTPISSTIFWAFKVRTYGIQETRTSTL